MMNIIYDVYVSCIICIYVHIYTYLYICIYVYIHVCMCMNTHTRTHKHAHARAHTHTHAYTQEEQNSKLQGEVGDALAAITPLSKTCYHLLSQKHLAVETLATESANAPVRELVFDRSIPAGARGRAGFGERLSSVTSSPLRLGDRQDLLAKAGIPVGASASMTQGGRLRLNRRDVDEEPVLTATAAVLPLATSPPSSPPRDSRVRRKTVTASQPGVTGLRQRGRAVSNPDQLDLDESEDLGSGVSHGGPRPPQFVRYPTRGSHQSRSPSPKSPPGLRGGGGGGGGGRTLARAKTFIDSVSLGMTSPPSHPTAARRTLSRAHSMQATETDPVLSENAGGGGRVRDKSPRGLGGVSRVAGGGVGGDLGGEGDREILRHAQNLARSPLHSRGRRARSRFSFCFVFGFVFYARSISCHTHTHTHTHTHNAHTLRSMSEAHTNAHTHSVDRAAIPSLRGMSEVHTNDVVMATRGYSAQAASPGSHTPSASSSGSHDARLEIALARPAMTSPPTSPRMHEPENTFVRPYNRRKEQQHSPKGPELDDWHSVQRARKASSREGSRKPASREGSRRPPRCVCVRVRVCVCVCVLVCVYMDVYRKRGGRGGLEEAAQQARIPERALYSAFI